ncbi:hypothetical protein [Herbaspirillum sp. C9C3]|uniref:hypothetical protein n=1 Tax=Herbaspirillum sp. C9C3 TaxID=2735271 RepID=UPI001584F2BC|nr:hypothetical protein [Herbaspirillum sp. C9C3]NUT60640.1 hypothetical protein [Herbaspirillum sp. C9C3]
MAATSPATQSHAEELKSLRAAIYDMDALSQSAFYRIAGIANLALMAMETPEAYLHPEKLAQAFEAIAAISEDAVSCISHLAEETGNSHKGGSEARFSARLKAEQMRGACG